MWLCRLVGLTCGLKSGPVGGHDDDWLVSTVGDPVADAPEDTVGEAAVALGADDQHVRVFADCEIEQRSGRRIVLDDHGAILDTGGEERLDPSGV